MFSTCFVLLVEKSGVFTIQNCLRFALAIFSGRIILNFGATERLRAFRCSIFTGGVWNELPQSKPDGFASSLGEGASGAPANFAL